MSCSRNPPAGLRRLVFLPANVLISDSSSDWIRLAAPLVLEQDLATSPNLVVSVVNDESQAYQSEASGVVRTTIENRQGRISIQATITELSTQKNSAILRTAGASSSGFLPVLNELSRQLDGHAIAFSTQSDPALQAFAAAAALPDPQSRAQMLGKAITIDPAFGLAYLVLAESAAQAGGQNAAAVIDAARPHAPSFTPLDRARFQALTAGISHAPLAQQEKADSAVLHLAPNDANTLAALGAIRFLENNAAEGQRLYASALQLHPGDVNLRRQLAAGLLETRQFAPAEKVFDGLISNSPVLPGLAVCILLQGDAARAGAVFDKFIASRPPNDPLNPLIRAEWLALSGDLPKAIQSLQGIDSGDPGVRTLILSQMTVWQLLAGDFAGAKISARQATQLDSRPTAFSALARLLAAADQPAEQWRQQVDSSPLNQQVKDSVLAYGLFFGGHFQDAAQSWRAAVQQSGNADLRARAMLAGSLDRAGEHDEASKVLVEPFIPDLGDLYSAVSFSEMHRLLRIGVR